MGWEANTARADAAGDDEFADRWRYWCFCLNEACAILALEAESRAIRALQAATANGTTPTKPGTPDGGTLKKGVISGRIPYRPQDAPAWLDAMFPEGEGVTLAPPTPLI